MAGDAPNTAGFKPAPFPTYQPNRVAPFLSWLRAGLAVAVCIIAVLPFGQRGSDAARGEIRYYQLNLPVREPVTISLGKRNGLAGFEILPEQLGWIDERGNFNYRAEVTRGFVFGQYKQDMLVLEINSPWESDPDVTYYLDRIREQVEVLNQRKNLLRSARESSPPGSPPSEAELKGMLAQYSANLPGEQTMSPPGERPTVGFEDLSGAAAILIEHSRHQAELKRLYYATQDARLDLLITQFDLQLALATMPDQDIPGLLSLGSSAVAQETMLAEIERISQAWSERKTELERRLAENKYLLSRTGTASKALAPQQLGTEFHTRSVFEPPWAAIQEPLLDGPAQVQASIAMAAIVVDQAEIEMIESSLAKLSSTHGQVSLGVLSFQGQSQLELRLAGFARPPLESLPRYQDIEASIHAGTAASVVEALSNSFISSQPPPGGKPGYSPNEFAYMLALLAIAELADPAQPLFRGAAEESALLGLCSRLSYEWFGLQD